ncbi:MAG TPA: hypothetical protein VHW69_08085 [Rhizomicrobium sp.]|nr:hypothetical protein [Rhizomicrobium sp.]
MIAILTAFGSVIWWVAKLDDRVQRLDDRVQQIEKVLKIPASALNAAAREGSGHEQTCSDLAKRDAAALEKGDTYAPVYIEALMDKLKCMSK